MIRSSSPQVLVEQHNPILHITLNRPERKNALSLAMYSALAEIIHAANQQPDIRVLLLKGHHDFFTSGNDLMDFMSDPVIRDDHPTVRFINALTHSAKPVVAIVKGHAIGIGTTLLMHCDLIYVAEDARLQLPFVNLGLSPEYASSYLLPLYIGKARANELLLLGELFSGKDAAQWGLVNAAMPSNELDDYANDKIQRLASQPPGAVRRSKKLLALAQKESIEKILQAEYEAFAEGLNSEECKEAVNAFFEKRAPDFSRF